MTSIFVVAVQMLAAFVIFVAGFMALLTVVMVCVAVGWILYWCAVGLQERLRFPGAKTVWLRRLRFARSAGDGD